MEKLIELLNEYRKEKGERSLNEFEVSQTLDSLNYFKLFIKWLVENEKIDYEKLSKEGFIVRTYDLDEIGESFDYVERLLMLLSIQDGPIEFLVSILK